MKKLALILVALFTLGISACEKDTNLKNFEPGCYQRVHIQLNVNHSIVHDKVISYKFATHGTFVQIETERSGWIAMNDGFMLYNSEKCPICGF